MTVIRPGAHHTKACRAKAKMTTWTTSVAQGHGSLLLDPHLLTIFVRQLSLWSMIDVQKGWQMKISAFDESALSDAE